MPEEIEELNKLVQELMQENFKITKALREYGEKVVALEARVVALEKVVTKLIGEFERHSHNGLGIAVIPVS